MKKNRNFFYLQYNKINWKNQEKTKINSYIYDYIIQNILTKHQEEDISIFDIGLGIGFFIKMLVNSLVGKYRRISIEGCEPSKVNYEYFLNQKFEGIDLKTFPTSFLETQTGTKFDYVTAIYVFPHFLFEDLEIVAGKSFSMLKPNGKFILVLANEEYLKEKLENQRDLFIESGKVAFRGKQYGEVLHYSDIPEIGKVIDYNREENFYLDLFDSTGFSLELKEELNDNGFICSLYVFMKP